MCEVYQIDNVIDFVDYMSIIKQTINNFDEIYYNKTNTDEVIMAKQLIESLNNKKGKK